MVPLRRAGVAFEVYSAGSGPPAVFLHSVFDAPGAGGRSPLVDRLAGRRTVHAPLHPGVGGSIGLDRLDDLFDLVLAYDELLDALGPGPVDLVGHSHGGMLAAELAAVFPSRVRRLALLAPFGLWRDDAPPADVLILPPAELARALWADPDSPAARAWAALPQDETANVAAQIEWIQRRAAIGKFVWPLPDRGLRKRLHRIVAPTLVVWGESDRANPPVYAQAWREGIAGARVATVPGGHLASREAPDAIAALIGAFLDTGAARGQAGGRPGRSPTRRSR